MTRRDQILRAWIERESPAENWQSIISYKGKLHRKSTYTKLRKAAKEFAHLHLTDFFTSKPTVTPTTHQPSLFDS